MRSALTVSLLLAALAAPVPAQTLASRGVSGVSGDGTVSVSLRGPAADDVWMLAREFARRTGVPIGVESIYVPPNPAGPGRDARTLTLKGATLGELLDSLAASDPRYHWREEQGSIVIRPVAMATDPGDPLNQAVPARTWSNVDALGLLAAIRTLSVGDEPQPAAETGHPVRGDAAFARRVSFAFPGGTLLDLLGAATAANGGLCWEVATERQPDGTLVARRASFASVSGAATTSATIFRLPPGTAERVDRDSPASSRRRTALVPLPLDDQRLESAVKVLAGVTGRPFGFEARPSPALQVMKGPSPGDPMLDLAGMEVADALARLLRDMPDYEWVEIDGVVNVLPRGARDDPDDILNRVVPEFDLTEATIDQLPAAVQNIFSPRPLPRAVPPDDQILPARREQYAHRVTLHLRNHTVREILNAIVRARPKTSWDVSLATKVPAPDWLSVGFSAEGYSAGTSGQVKRKE